MAGALREYLRDPFLDALYKDVRAAPALRSISIDLTEACNLRCAGCYFFTEGMDRAVVSSDAQFDTLLDREKARGTNFVTVVGGEPSLELGRLKKIYDGFWMNVATNGLRRIPDDGFEEMPIGVSVWGTHATDRKLRGSGRVETFATALRNYRDDPRAFWYYTVTPGHAAEIPDVVARCVDNGNDVLFNFYGDVAGLGGKLDSRRGFDGVLEAIGCAIERFPERILMTASLSRVVATGRLYDERWGHAVCTSVTFDHEANHERVRSAKPLNPHFRAYNADFQTTRRCCTGIDRNCSSCFDTWEHYSWVMLNMRKHLGSKQEFTEWLTTTYLFYFVNRLVDVAVGKQRLPEIHRRVGRSITPESPGRVTPPVSADRVAQELAAAPATHFAHG